MTAITNKEPLEGPTPQNFYLRRYLIWGGIALLCAGLAILSYRGIYNRFWADDWCYNANFKNLGFIRTMQGYYDITTYASNRFSLTLFSGIFSSLGLIGVMILPSLVIILWVVSLFMLIGRISSLTKRLINRAEQLFISLLLVYFVLFIAPNQFQILYWRSAVLPYTFPIIGLNFILLAIANHILVHRAKNLIGLLVGSLTFIAVGFSEIGGTFILGILITLLILDFAFTKKLPERFSRARMPLVIAIVSGAASLAILVFCPSNIPRQAHSYTAPTPFIDLPMLTIRLTIQYVINFFSSYILPVCVLILTGLLLGIGIGRKNNRSLSDTRNRIGWIALILAGAFLASYAMLIPSAYIEKAIPEEGRALIIGTYTLANAIFAISLIVGEWAGGYLDRYLKVKPQLQRIIVLFLILALSAYTMRTFTYALATFPFFEKRASVWDERDTAIKQAIERDQTSIDVREIDSYMGVLELHPEPNWINGCAADYYGLNEIRATLPWD